MSIEDVVGLLAVDLLGIVPDDENIVVSTNQGEPLVGTDCPDRGSLPEYQLSACRGRGAVYGAGSYRRAAGPVPASVPEE